MVGGERFTRKKRNRNKLITLSIGIVGQCDHILQIREATVVPSIFCEMFERKKIAYLKRRYALLFNHLYVLKFMIYVTRVWYQSVYRYILIRDF